MKVVIIGNGISGVTAARHIRKHSDHDITIISSETPHFFSRTALMYIYMGHLKYEHTKPYEDSFWKKNRLNLVFDHVEKINTDLKSLQLKSGQTINYDALIIASGSKPNFGHWNFAGIKGIQGFYSYPDLLQLEENTRKARKAVVVGGGLIGVELAEMLHSRKIDVTLLVRDEYYWQSVLPKQEAALIARHIRSHGVNLIPNAELKDIQSSNGRVCGVSTSRGETIPCDFVAVAIGVNPNVEFLANSGILCNRGVLVDENLRTNIEGVYAIGDCAERRQPIPGRKAVEQVWYTGRMMGEVVAQTICGNPTPYEPGPWFNSAKFFDVEYQTYGDVISIQPPDEDELYWEHHEGKKAVHLRWKKMNRTFVGVNTFGIRYRHELFDRWLREGKDIEFVVNNLPHANFDPEFVEKHEHVIQQAFHQKFQTVNV